MQVADLLQLLAIILECAVAIIAVLVAVQYRKIYGWLIALTFGLFALFDIFRVFTLPVPADLHALILLVASASMVTAVWMMLGELSGR